MCFVSIHGVHPYSSIDTVKAWKKSHFISLDGSDFHMSNNLSVAVDTLVRHMLQSLSVDEMLLPRYVNLSTNLKGLQLRVEVAPFRLKHVLYFICVHTKADAFCC